MLRRARVRAKKEREIERMRGAGRIVGRVLDELSEAIRPGVTTGELDEMAEALIGDLGGVPSFKGYHGYPACICASINEQVVHGIPGPRRVQDGDVVSVDVGAIWQGYHGDATVSVNAGSIDGDTERLLVGTRAALVAGIAAAQVGARLGDVSHAIGMAAREYGLGIVRRYGGHGIGRHMHEVPQVWNDGPGGQGIVLQEGMTFALEPMLCLGEGETRELADGWTVVTADGACSAHFEHTIVVREGGGEILTKNGVGVKAD